MRDIKSTLRRVFDNRVHAAEITATEAARLRLGDRIVLSDHTWCVWRCDLARDVLYIW